MEISQELQITFNEQKVFFEKKPASFTYLAFIIAFIFSFPMKIFRLLKSFKKSFYLGLKLFDYSTNKIISNKSVIWRWKGAKLSYRVFSNRLDSMIYKYSLLQCTKCLI